MDIIVAENVLVILIQFYNILINYEIINVNKCEKEDKICKVNKEYSW